MAVKRKPKRKPDDDDDKRTTKTVRKTTGPEPMRTSSITTAPEFPEGAADSDDLQAFFSSGHGAAQHYDWREERAEGEGEQNGA
jgi:hypothetical protein